MSNFQSRRFFSPATRRSKSPSSSRRSRSPVQDRNSRRRPVSRDRKGSPSYRISVSPLSRRRFSPCRSRSPSAPASSRRSVSRDRRGSASYRRSVSPLSRKRQLSPRRSRSPAVSSSRRPKSPYRRSQSPRALNPWSGRRMSPTQSRGHKRARSPTGKRTHDRHISEGPDNGPSTQPSSGRIRYPSQPGPMGRYNSRLGREWDGDNTGQKREWTCSKCSEIFFEQRLYVEHVKKRNLQMKCPGRGELLVLDDYSLAADKKERRPANKKLGPLTEVILDDSPPHIGVDSSAEASTHSPTTAYSDSELPPIVPPPYNSSLSLEPVSDQSLPTSPVITSAPASLPLGPNFLPTAATGSSPSKLPQEIIQSRVKFREDGVLMFDEVTVQAKKIIKFKKNLFKVLPDLLDIPDTTTNAESVVQPIPAKANTEEPTNMSPAACEGLVLTKSLESANSLLQSLPNTSQPISVVEGFEPRRKLPKCLREDDEVEEPALVSRVKAPKSVDAMELLLDKRARKQFIQKKATSKEDSPGFTKKSTEEPNHCAVRPIQKDLVREHAGVASSLTKKRKKGKKRLKDKMKNQLLKEVVNVSTKPSNYSLVVESTSSQSNVYTSQGLAALKLVNPSSPVPEQTILSPVSSCSLSESALHSIITPSVPSSSQLPHASASNSLTVLPSSTISIISTSAARSLSTSTSSSTSSPSTSKHSMITTSSSCTSSSAVSSTTPLIPTPTSSLAAELSPQPSSTSARSDAQTDSLATVSSGGVFTVAWQLSSPPRVSPSSGTTTPSPPTPPIYEGEVMSLYQAIGGSPPKDDEVTPQPVIIRADVDCMNKCPDCKAKLETGARALNFSVNMADLSVLVDCVQCGVRVRLVGVLGASQRAVLGCGM